MIASGTCAVCGLRYVDRWDGLHHMNTAAGRAADRDHRPQRKDRPPSVPPCGEV